MTQSCSGNVFQWLFSSWFWARAFAFLSIFQSWKSIGFAIEASHGLVVHMSAGSPTTEASSLANGKRAWWGLIGVSLPLTGWQLKWRHKGWFEQCLFSLVWYFSKFSFHYHSPKGPLNNFFPECSPTHEIVTMDILYIHLCTISIAVFYI